MTSFARTAPVLFAIGFLVLSSCIEPAADSTEGMASVSMLDGVETIEAGVLWSQAPELLSPVFHFPDTSNDSIYFVDIADAALLGDKTLVMDRGLFAVLLFDNAGHLVRRVGSQGEGPGEFSSMTHLDTCDGGRFAVLGVDRVTVFNDEGQLVGTERFEPRERGAGRWLWGISADCGSRLVGVTPVQRPEPDDLVVSLQWVHHDETVDSITTVPWVRRYEATVMGRPTHLVRPWATQTIWTTAGNQVAVASADAADPDVSVFGLDGDLMRRFTWEPEPRRISPDDREAYQSARTSYLEDRPEVEHQIYPPLDEVPVPDTPPGYAGLQLDEDGVIWLKRYPSEEAGRLDLTRWHAGPYREQWALIPSGGGKVRVLQFPMGHRLLDVSGERAVTVKTDELGRHTVALFSLQ